MLTRSDLEARIQAALASYPELLARYNAGDPLVRFRLGAMADFLTLLAQDIDVASLEPFLKTRERTVLADASNKGILPVATPAQHQLSIANNGNQAVTLSAGRLLDDGQGRPWRLLSGATLAIGASAVVTAEQSTLRTVPYTVGVTESFHRVILPLADEVYLAGISIMDSEPTPNTYRRSIKWMNTEAGALAYHVMTDSRRRLIIEFGDDDRAGRTARVGDVYQFTLLETYGEVDALKLREAVLQTLDSPAENGLKLTFVSASETGAVVRAGASPLSINQLRILSSYPTLYDENAVFMGNFEFLVRRQFASRFDYFAVWNETIQERIYVYLSVTDINRLRIAVVAKTASEQAALEADIAALIGKADSLYSGGIKLVTNPSGHIIPITVVERPYTLTITGRLSSVYDIDAVTVQIKNALLAKYGKGAVMTSKWLPDGISLQEAASCIRNQVPAFQDNISDFSVQGEDLGNSPVKPHQWLYVSAESIVVNLTRTADSGGNLWTL